MDPSQSAVESISPSPSTQHEDAQPKSRLTSWIPLEDLPNRTSSATNFSSITSTTGNQEGQRAGDKSANEDVSWVANSAQNDTVRYAEICSTEGTGWSAMSKALRDYDEEEIRYCKEDIDTLLVFAGLYSAVLSAFIIESLKALKPDPGDQMVYLFQQMIAQNYTMSSGFLNATNPHPPLPNFKAPSWAVRVNVLWSASLVVSLSAASYGMLVKQWFREYLNMSEQTAPQERLRARQYRRPALTSWKVFQIGASLPLLLELSLALFFVGLCFFTTAVHYSVSRSTIPFVAAWAFLFTIATIAPLISPRCPFKTTLLKGAMKQARRLILMVGVYLAPIYTLLAKYTSQALSWCARTVSQCVSSMWKLVVHYAGVMKSMFSCPSSVSRFHIKTPSLIALGISRETRHVVRHLTAHMQEEETLLKRGLDDITILRSVDEIMPGDGLLPTIVDIAWELKPSWDVTFDFVGDIISSHTGQQFIPYALGKYARDMQLLSKQALDALTVWMSNILLSHFGKSHTLDSSEYTQCAGLFLSLISSHDRPLLQQQQNAFYLVIFEPVDEGETHPTTYFAHMHPFRHRLNHLFADPLSPMKRPSNLSFESWSEPIEDIITRFYSRISDEDGDLDQWVGSALVLLISSWKAAVSAKQPKGPRHPQPLSLELIQSILDAIFKSVRLSRYHWLDIEQARDLYYSILLGVARSPSETEFPPQIATRTLQSSYFYLPVYNRKEKMSPIRTPFTAFVSWMDSLSAEWGKTVLEWLAPYRMPGNILAEIVVQDMRGCEREEQLLKLEAIVELCRTVSGIDCPEDEAVPLIDFSSLLQIIIMLDRLDGAPYLDAHIDSIRSGFRLAVLRRHSVYRAYMTLMSKIVKSRRPTTYRLDFDNRMWRFTAQMRKQRLDLVYAMTYGCYCASDWVGRTHRGASPSGQLRLVVKQAWVIAQKKKALVRKPTTEERRSIARSTIFNQLGQRGDFVVPPLPALRWMPQVVPAEEWRYTGRGPREPWRPAL